MVVKTRNTQFRKDLWQEWRGSVNSPYNPTNGDQGFYYANGTDDLITSFGHNLSRLGKGDVGGPFESLTHQLDEQNVGPARWRANTPDNDSSTGTYNYFGSYYAAKTSVTNSHFPVVNAEADANMAAAGTTAIARVIPTNPLTGLATSLAELKREGIPAITGASLLRERALRARNAGSEYLNAEFGWRPLVNDVLSLATSIIDSDELVRKYEQESGKRLHRRYTFPVDIQTSTFKETGKYPQPALKTAYWQNAGTLETTTRITSKRWFSGCFTYYLAPQGSIARAEQIAAKRFGHRITPEVLWNLTPWSWAADWVTNIGDIAHNVSAFSQDGLVMPYGYMMHEKVHETTYYISGAITKHKGKEIKASQTFRTIRRQRSKATPFGFGLNPAGFSGRQWAILGALGLSRSPGHLY